MEYYFPLSKRHNKTYALRNLWESKQNYKKSFSRVEIMGNFHGQMMEIICFKAPGNYSAPFWSNRFSICQWENTKSFISMFSGLSNLSPSPKTNSIYLWRHQDIFKKPIKKKPWRILPKYYFHKYQIFVFHFFVILGKDGRRKIPPVRPIKSWKSLIWDQYLLESTKLFFW